MRSKVNDANTGLNFEALLSRIKAEETLSTAEITFLLNLQDEDQIRALFQEARDLRQNYFGNKIFIYGFIYASTYCRNDCRFCLFRRSNLQPKRYRKSKQEIVAAAMRLADSGVPLIDLRLTTIEPVDIPEILRVAGEAAPKLTRLVVRLVDLTMGEDPDIFNSDGAGFDRLVDLVASLQKKTGLPIMVSPGVVPADVLQQLAAAGAVWYACY